MELESAKSVIVEEIIDVCFYWLRHYAAIVIDDVLEPGNWWLGDWYWEFRVIHWVFCDAGTDVVCIRVHESKEPVWLDLYLYLVPFFCFPSFWVTLFCELV